MTIALTIVLGSKNINWVHQYSCYQTESVFKIKFNVLLKWKKFQTVFKQSKINRNIFVQI